MSLTSTRLRPPPRSTRRAAGPKGRGEYRARLPASRLGRVRSGDRTLTPIRLTYPCHGPRWRHPSAALTHTSSAPAAPVDCAWGLEAERSGDADVSARPRRRSPAPRRCRSPGALALPPWRSPPRSPQIRAHRRVQFGSAGRGIPRFATPANNPGAAAACWAAAARRPARRLLPAAARPGRRRFVLAASARPGHHRSPSRAPFTTTNRGVHYQAIHRRRRVPPRRLCDARTVRPFADPPEERPFHDQRRSSDP